MNKREEAKRMFRYYFRLIAKQSGINWDSDNEAEIDYAIDLLIEASKEEVKGEKQ